MFQVPRERGVDAERSGSDVRILLEGFGLLLLLFLLLLVLLIFFFLVSSSSSFSSSSLFFSPFFLITSRLPAPPKPLNPNPSYSFQTARPARAAKPVDKVLNYPEGGSCPARLSGFITFRAHHAEAHSATGIRLANLAPEIMLLSNLNQLKR